MHTLLPRLSSKSFLQDPVSFSVQKYNIYIACENQKNILEILYSNVISHLQKNQLLGVTKAELVSESGLNEYKVRIAILQIRQKLNGTEKGLGIEFLQSRYRKQDKSPTKYFINAKYIEI
jgi:hypothetical protein